MNKLIRNKAPPLIRKDAPFYELTSDNGEHKKRSVTTHKVSTPVLEPDKITTIMRRRHAITLNVFFFPLEE